MKLSIVIPALNEEDAIGAIIERCLAARATIVEHSPRGRGRGHRGERRLHRPHSPDRRRVR